MTKPFDSTGQYYELLYKEKDSAAESAYVDSLLLSNGIRGRILLEFGCGTGRHACMLAQRGYRIYGMDSSSAMVQATKKMSGFHASLGDCTTTYLGRTVDAVLALFHVISYQITNKAILATFANAAKHLTSGGLFLFDVWYSPAVAVQRPEVRVKRLESELLTITRIAEPIIHPNENRVDVNYTVIAQHIDTGTLHTFTEIHPMRHFSLPEIDLLAQYTGFERIITEEWLTKASPSETTWAVCVVLRKI
jgi:SAM-dependent methyltransferase